MSDRYMNDEACGIEPEREGDEPTLEQWRERCRQLYRARPQLRWRPIASAPKDKLIFARSDDVVVKAFYRRGEWYGSASSLPLHSTFTHFLTQAELLALPVEP